MTRRRWPGNLQSHSIATVFKMMFFRRKDLADVEQILRSGGKDLDRTWVRRQLIGIYGARDPRIAGWDELCSDVAT